MKRFALCFAAAVSLSANAQQLDVFDPDDFVDPELTRGRVLFISRLVTGVSRGYTDQYRRLGDDVGFAHLANSVYLNGFQLDLKRSEVRRENGPGGRVTPGEPHLEVYLNNSPLERSLDTGGKTVSQLSWYLPAGDRLLMRYRLLYATQDAGEQRTANGAAADRDETRMGQLDAGIRLGSRMQFFNVSYAELTRHSTFPKTKQRTTTIGALLPLIRIGPAVLSPRLQLGAIANSGRAIDIVNPSIDAALHIGGRVDTNFHVVYSPMHHDGLINHQVVIYADRALLVRSFGKRGRGQPE